MARLVPKGIDRENLDELKKLPFVKCYEWGEYSGHVVMAIGIGGFSRKADLYQAACRLNELYEGSVSEDILDKVKAVCMDDQII